MKMDPNKHTRTLLGLTWQCLKMSSRFFESSTSGCSSHANNLYPTEDHWGEECLKRGNDPEL